MSVIEVRKPPTAPPVYRPASPPIMQRTTGQKADIQHPRQLNLTRTRNSVTNSLSGSSQATTSNPIVGNKKQNGSPPDRANAQKPAIVLGEKKGNTTEHERINKPSVQRKPFPGRRPVIQRKIGFEFEVAGVETEKNSSWCKSWPGAWTPHQRGAVIVSKARYDITADISRSGSRIEFVTKPIEEASMAEVRQLRQTARDITADLRAIHDASKRTSSGWVGADEIPRINGWWWHRFWSTALQWEALYGQLQMTGGIKLSSLHRVVSGSAIGQEPRMVRAHILPTATPRQREIEQGRAMMTRYFQADIGGTTRQPVYQAAIAATGGRFAGWGPEGKRTLASVISLMAQVPIEKRMGGEYSTEGPGLLMAKTAYSKILQLITAGYRREIPADEFVNALVDTINAVVPGAAAVQEGDPVFPPAFTVGGLTFTGLSIGSWARNALPNVDFLEEDEEDQVIEGVDQLSSAHFPGTSEQKKVLRAFGTFGSQTDSGNKVIFEWRSLTLTHPDDLETAMLNLVGYLRGRVNG